MTLETFGLSAWPFNALSNAGITDPDQIATMTDAQLLALRGLGTNGLDEIRSKMGEHIAPKSDTSDPLDTMPKPDMSLDVDPQLLLLIDLAIDTSLPKRHASMLRQRLSLADGGAWNTLEVVGVQHGISRERVRQIMIKVRRRLQSSTLPEAVLLRRYLARSVGGASDSPPEALAAYGTIAFPVTHQDYAFSFIGHLAFAKRDVKTRNRIIDKAVAIKKAERHESQLAWLQAKELAQNSRKAATVARRLNRHLATARKRVDQWINETYWPQLSQDDAFRIGHVVPGRDSSRAATSCTYDSVILDRPVSCESELERSLFLALDLSGLVQWYVEQPFSIEYQDQLGQWREYWPDALVHLKDGRWLLVEVKPHFYFVNERNQRKWRSALIRCKERGVGFLVVNPALSLTLGEVATRTVPKTLDDAIHERIAVNSWTSWNDVKLILEAQDVGFLDFAAWALQNRCVVSSHPSWGITAASVTKESIPAWQHVARDFCPQGRMASEPINTD